MIVFNWLALTFLTGLLGILLMTRRKPTKFVLYYHAFRIIALSGAASAFFVVHSNKVIMILAVGLIPVLSAKLIRLEISVFNKFQQVFK